MLVIRDGQHRFQTAQHAVGTPVFGEFHGAFQQIALIFVELRFKTLKQREGVRRAACETGQNALLIETAHLAGAGLDDDVAQRHLPVAAECDFAPATNGNNRGTAILFHVVVTHKNPAGKHSAACPFQSSERKPPL